MNKYTDSRINEKLYQLLKEPLGLSDRCVGFTLTVSMEKPPEVKQTYYCQSKLRNTLKSIRDQDPKVKYEIVVVHDEDGQPDPEKELLRRAENYLRYFQRFMRGWYGDGRSCESLESLEKLVDDIENTRTGETDV